MGLNKRAGEAAAKPDPEWIRGVCPKCGAELVSNSYYVAGRGYLVIWECWSAVSDEPTCDYRRVL
jgi:hypothetical protein